MSSFSKSEVELAAEVPGNMETSWVLGVDVGDRSVGLAAVEFEGGTPKRILSAVSYTHDGGVLDEKTKESGLASSGTSRRIRQMRRRRAVRLRKVNELLTELGFEIPNAIGDNPYQAWSARRELTEKPIADDSQRSKLLGLAISHMAGHRGWRNPWISTSRLYELERPSQSAQDMFRQAEERLALQSHSIETYGQLGALVLDYPGLRLRSVADKASLDPSLTFNRLRQEDILAELEMIGQIQGIPDSEVRRIAETIFDQAKPHVPVERIGKDPFCDLPRAPRASLEFQEFRIRDKVANLRIVADEGERRLTTSESEKVVSHLIGTRAASPSWAEVATDLLELPSEKFLKIPEGTR